MCRHFKHCAPVVVNKNKCEIYQFTRCGQINIIPIRRRDIRILEKYGWKFVKYNIKHIPQDALYIRAMTCVQFTKKFCKIKNLKIQTPDALLMYLKTHIK